MFFFILVVHAKKPYKKMGVKGAKSLALKGRGSSLLTISVIKL
jgi:hypothetical protein